MRKLLILIAMLSLQSCIFLDAPDDDREGYTECGDFLGDDNQCQPGSYCSDLTFSECSPGCLSNDNCAQDQRCVKSDGTDIGTCQNAKNREASRSGLTPCGTEFSGEEASCQPGSYCEDATFSRCEAGCLSDANCPPDEECMRGEGEAVGVCAMPASMP